MSRPDSLRHVQGVVFDLDGTLIDSYEAITESLNHALSSMGRDPIGATEVRGMVGRGLEVLIEIALRRTGSAEASDPAAVARAVGLFRARYDLVCVEKTSLLPDVAVTLPELRRRGYRMAVATNKPSYFAARLLDALGVSRHLDAVLGPDLVAHPKPHPGMVLAALGRMGTVPGKAVYVGDMSIDVETARAAGVPVIVLPTGSSPIEHLRASGADIVLPSFGALLDLLPGPLLESKPY